MANLRLKRTLLFLRHSYSLDPRALGLMRIAVALLVIADLIIRAQDLEAHYTARGCWPANLLKHSGWKNGYWTFHDLFDNSSFVSCLFILHFLLALGLLLGYYTKTITALLFMFTISLHNRNIFILQAGDDQLRITLLWGLLLSWGQCYSLDAKAGTRPVRPPLLAGMGYLVFIASIYLFSVLLKSGDDWHRDNTALYYALSLEQIRLPAGDWLYNHDWLLKLLTAAAYYCEAAIPILILLPFGPRRRILAFSTILLLHFFIGAILYVGLFFMISICCAIGMLPAEIFTRQGKLVKRFHAARRMRQLLSNNLAIVLVIVMLIIDLSFLPWFGFRLSQPVERAANFLRLDQYWGMFSPQVLRKDGWFVYHGQDSIGRQWDLHTNEEYVSYKKPKRIVSMYSSDRWRKLAENMQDERFTFLRPLYCRYLITTWNARHPEKQMTLLNLYYMEKLNQPDYKAPIITKKLYSVCDAK